MASESPDVLISGAGPTGLTLALDLARAGVPVRIVDKNSARSVHSKAFGVHAGTLECFEHVFGDEIVSKMISAGSACRQVALHLDSAPPIPINVGIIPSRYNHILVLAQSETERILEETLATYDVRVERNTEFVSLKGGEAPTCEVKLPDGRLEEVRPRFVVGCDGAHSTVRRQLGLDFEGGAYEGSFLLADVTLDWPWDFTSVHLFATSKGVMATFPMNGDRKYRLIFIDTPKSAAIPVTDVKGLNEKIEGIGIQGVKVLAHDWLTPFRVHHRIVKRFQVGPVFLAGDAAHIHSPAGGQGMNIGMQEALSLGVRMRRALDDGSFDPLNDYEQTRKPIAQTIMKNTDFIFRIALMNEGPIKAFGRRFVAPRLVQWNWLQHRVIRGISEVDLAHQLIAFRETLA
ncbi:MAG: FAD-dependent monooxygenase [Bdellovibrionia bacterium]